MTIQEEIEQLKKENLVSKKELNKLFADIAKGFGESRKLIDDIDLQLSKQADSTQKFIADIGKQVASTERTIKDMGKQLGGIGNSNGAYAEEIFYSSLSKQKKLGKIKYDAVDKNVHFTKKGIRDEFDIVMVNGDSIALIEVKYKATQEHLKILIEKKLDSFKKLFPEFKDYKFYLGLAGLSFESKAFEQEVLKKGVAVLKAVGDHTEVFADNLKVY